MRVIKLSEDSYQTLLWLIGAYLSGDIEGSESYDSEENDYKAVKTLEKEIKGEPF